MNRFFLIAFLSTALIMLNFQAFTQSVHPDSALIVLKKMQAKAIMNEDAVTEGSCLQQMGQICFNQGHYAQALDFYLRADKIFDGVGNKDLLAANMRVYPS